MRPILYIYLAFLFITSCNKKECIEIVELSSKDTIFPNEYLPAYPGSWWEYNDNVIIKTYNNWQEFEVEHYAQGKKCDYRIKDIKLVPVIDTDNDQYVLGNTVYRWETGNNSSSFNEDLIFNNNDTNWRSWESLNTKSVKGGGSYSTNYLNRKLIETIPYFEVNDMLFEDVKVIKESFVDSEYMGDTYIFKIFYYAKNVGIIKEISQYPQNSDSVALLLIHDTLEITNYFINK